MGRVDKTAVKTSKKLHVCAHCSTTNDVRPTMGLQSPLMLAVDVKEKLKMCLEFVAKEHSES